MRMRFLPDTPIQTGGDDFLQFGSFVELIKLSLESTEPPFVYGLLGDWGTGKTSILHLLQVQLKDHPTLVPIWFNAWKYENEANLIYPLLSVIKQQYDNDPALKALQKERAFKDKFKQVVATSAFVVGDIGLRAATKYLTDQAVGVEDLDKQLKAVQDHLAKTLAGWSDNVSRLESDFAGLLEAYAQDIAPERGVKGGDIRFVILIDDLDRCLPATTLTILESIKNYLSAPNVLFVLAINPRVVYQGIKAKYNNLDVDGREYLEKILNYAFHVPEPTLAQVTRFASDRLDRLVPDEADRQRQRAKFEEFGRVLEACHFNNPRKIKRILNRFLLFLSQHERAGTLSQYNLSNIIRLLIMAEYYPILFNLVQSQQDPGQFIKAITHQTTYATWEKEHDLTVPATYPPLGRLRELFNLVTSGQSPAPELAAVHTLCRLW